MKYLGLLALVLSQGALRIKKYVGALAIKTFKTEEERIKETDVR